MEGELFTISIGEKPIVATAIHSGHSLRPEVAELCNITDNERLREEDPFTAGWTDISESKIICHRSRFEVDINRIRDKAVYITPEDAWGLCVWKKEPSANIIKESLANYDKFYKEVKQLLFSIESRFEYFVLLDLHSYNYLRGGSNTPPADPAHNPEVNIGTDSVSQGYWKPLIKHFISDLRGFSYLGKHLDVRENIKFKGGNFPRWVNQTFPRTGCAIAVEFKKFFMNEWTGEIYEKEYKEIKKALASTLSGLFDELARIKTTNK